MKNKLILSCLLLMGLNSCISTKLTIKNIDQNAPILVLKNQKEFRISDFSTDKRYGYEADYPVNLFFGDTKNDSINQIRFLNALAGPNQEVIIFKKIKNCCPFMTKKTTTGAGFLTLYSIHWNPEMKPILLYLNGFEKGKVVVPVGFGLKK